MPQRSFQVFNFLFWNYSFVQCELLIFMLTVEVKKYYHHKITCIKWFIILSLTEQILQNILQMLWRLDAIRLRNVP